MATEFPLNFAPASSEGVLPIENSATQMRYRRSIIWEVDLFGFGIGSKTGEGSFTVTFKSEGGEVFFQQTVTVKLFMVSLSFPGLNLFTWNYVKDEFETSIVDGTEITPDNIGDYLLGGTALSEQGDLQPASGESSTDLTATIIADWVSPIYLFPSGIPGGTIVEISNDTWSFGAPKNAEYQWAFLESGSGDAIRDPRTGETWFFYVANGALRCSRTRRREGFDFEDNSPIIHAGSVRGFTPFRRGANLICEYGTGLGTHISNSADSGVTWRDDVVIESGVTSLAKIYDEKSGRMCIYGTARDDDDDNGIERGDVVRLFLTRTTEDGGWKIQVKEKIADPAPPTSGVVGLEENGGRYTLMVQDGSSARIFISTNGMASFTEQKPLDDPDI